MSSASRKALMGSGKKRVEINLVISGDSTNINVYTSATGTGNYSAGKTDVILTINSGIYVGSTSTGTYALTVPANFDTDDTVTIVNNGFIVGKAGAGGSPNSGAGAGGGNAILLNFPTIINNLGSIYGGGGGGGAGAYGAWGVLDKYCRCTAARNGGAGGSGAGYTLTGNGSKTGGGGGTNPGAATCVYLSNTVYAYGGVGGSGGGPGANGSTGGSSSGTGHSPFSVCGNSTAGGGAGGIRGYFVVNSITYAPIAQWITQGTTGGRSS